MFKKDSRQKSKVVIALILAFTLAIPFCGSFTFAAEKAAATVYTNGVVYTVEGTDWDKNPEESIAIAEDGTILFVGSDKDVQAYIGDDTEVINLNGKVVLPGFGDSHVHPPGTALTQLFEIDLYDAITKEQALEAVKDYIAENPDLDEYWGNGFSMGIGGAGADGKGPKKEWLDEICSDKPIILTSNDGHNMWLNSKAFEMNKITKDTVHPTGTVQKDANGELWGTLTDAFSLVTMEQEFTDAQIMEAMELFQDNMLGWGFTHANFMHSLQADTVMNAMKKLDDSGDWKMRANLSVRFGEDEDFNKNLNYFIESRKAFEKSDLLSVTTAKFFMDGVIEGMTGYLSKPYDAAAGLDPDYVSVPLWDVNELKEYFNTLMKNGAQIHVHSIGDEATTQTIDAMEFAQKNNPNVNTRNTITHLQVVKDSDKTRMGKLGIIGSTQPFWHLKEPEWFEYVDEVALGEERAWKEYPVKSLVDAGVTVTFSGDHPVTPINDPFWAIEVSVTRNLNNADYYGVDDITSIDDPTWLLNPAERISVKQAIECYTKNVSYQMFQEDKTGTLKAGKYADMIILDQDPLKVNSLNLDETAVLATIIGGEVVYEAEIFADISDHWAKDAILYVYDQGLFGGVGDGLFGPNGTMNRGMIVTVLGKYAEADVKALDKSCFDDVNVNMYYAPYVEWAEHEDIVSGIGDDLFGPNNPVTREQMATILFNFIESQEFEPSDNAKQVDQFNDYALISDWAKEPVVSMQQLGIMNGKPGGNFDPKGKVTRAEAASMLMNMMKVIKAFPAAVDAAVDTDADAAVDAE